MNATAEQIEQEIEIARRAQRAGEWGEALERYGVALALARREGAPLQVADLQRWIGTMHRNRGDAEQAEHCYRESLETAREHGLSAAIAGALTCLGTLAQHRGDLESAKAMYLEARSMSQRVADLRLTAMIDQNLGIVFSIQGDLRNALMRHEVALHTFQKLKDSWLGMRCLNNLGMIHVDLGEWTAAARCYDHAAGLAEQLQDLEMQGLVALNRTELHIKLREFDQARAFCDHAFEVFSNLDSGERRAEAHKFYGVLYRKTDKPNLAATHLSLAVQLAQAAGDRLLEAEAEYQTAQLHLDAERSAEAMQCLQRAHALFSDIHARRNVQDVDRRLDRMERTFLEVMHQWAESIESKDAYTAGHSRRVADHACMLAEAVGIAGRELTWFRMGAVLHDVGKIVVPVEVLNKPGKLTAEEWEIMRSHTVAGDEIVAGLGFPWDIRPMVRNHHEHWAGTGYPDGLAGEEIPLHARILCIADVFDALTSNRSYRASLSRDEALRVMESEAGTVLDPRLFPIFKRLILAGEGTTSEASPVAVPSA